MTKKFDPSSLIGVEFEYWNAFWKVRSFLIDDRPLFRCDWIGGTDRDEGDKKGVIFSLKDVFPNICIESDNLDFLPGLEFERLAFGVWTVASVGTLLNQSGEFMEVRDRVGNTVIEAIDRSCLEAILYRIELYQDYDPSSTDQDTITLEKIAAINKQVLFTDYMVLATGKQACLYDSKSQIMIKSSERLSEIVTRLEKLTYLSITL
ncbi:hypothetical protein [Chroococcidiopsis sp.]|uniref:hypothetical protein n=1 Tax=Chroococcidiopsis sp. TaxID=3088168 RepID=UPI003F2DD58A